MLKEKKIKVAIVTGSTGGHFFPGLAVAEELRNKHNTVVSFFVPEREYIKKWLIKKQFKYSIIPNCRLSKKDILSPLKFLYAFFKAISQLVSGKFALVLITGSYTTVPFLFAAKICRVNILVHEQNYKMGKVTKLSKYLADKIAVTFPENPEYPKKKVVLTGFPLISDFTQKRSREEIIREYSFSPNKLTILVFGGSQGSDFLNRLIYENTYYFKKLDLQFLHLTGSFDEKLRALYDKEGIPAKVFNFSFDMAKLYSIADIVICRAGAGTLAEINAWKIPAITIPYPYAGSHQKYNALFFSKQGACEILYQKEENLKNFPNFFDDFLKKRELIKKNMGNISISDLEGKTVKLILELIKNGKKYNKKI